MAAAAQGDCMLFNVRSTKYVDNHIRPQHPSRTGRGRGRGASSLLRTVEPYRGLGAYGPEQQSTTDPTASIGTTRPQHPSTPAPGAVARLYG